MEKQYLLKEIKQWSFNGEFKNQHRFEVDLPNLKYKEPKWYNLLWWRIKSLFRRRTNFEKYLRVNKVKFIYELKE